MKIGILGTGNVGRTLGIKWAKAGHPIMFGSRSPVEKQLTMGAGGEIEGDIEFQSIEHTSTWAEVLVFAVPSRVVSEIIVGYGPALNGKILVDATNDFSKDHTSRVDELAAAAPGSMIYRAFNSLGWELFETPRIGDTQVDLIYCGPDQAPQRQVMEQLISEIGLRPLWVGGLEMTSAVDALGKIWISLAIRQGRGRHLGINILEP